MQRYRIIAIICAILLAVLLPLAAAFKANQDISAYPVVKYEIEPYDPRDPLYGHYLQFRIIEPVEFTRRIDRFYVDERYALALEKIFREGEEKFYIGLAMRPGKEPVIEDLYIGSQRWKDYIAIHAAEGAPDHKGL